MSYWSGKRLVNKLIRDARKEQYQIGKNSQLWSRLEIINSHIKQRYVIYFELYDDSGNFVRKMDCEILYTKEGLDEAIKILEYASKFKMEDEYEK